MPDPNTEQTVDQMIDEAVDNYVDGKPQETPPPSSEESKPPVEESQEPKDAGDDQPKKSEPEEEEKKDAEEEKPEDIAFREKWNKAKDKLEAKHKKQMDELKGQLPPKEKMDEFMKVISSPSYIRESMRAQGYTQDAIDKTLREKGHEVPARVSNDMELVARSWGMTVEQLTQEDKQQIPVYAKMIDALIQDRLGKTLPDQLKSIQEDVANFKQERSASKFYDTMRSEVEKEGVLDFEKDIDSEVDKWLDENPNASQQEAYQYFKDLKHLLTLERLQGKKRKTERDKKKEPLRSNETGAAVDLKNVPKQTGNVSQDIDNLLDHFQIRE
jgi:hypothetical protein